jgi:DNA-binding NarL/FixJ family response regulator
LAILENKLKRQVVVAVSARELKTAIFLTLSNEPEIRVVATAANSAELLTFARSFQPAVIIYEMELKGEPLADVLLKLRQVSSDSKVLIISKPSSFDQTLDITTTNNIIRIDDEPETMLRLVKD